MLSCENHHGNIYRKEIHKKETSLEELDGKQEEVYYLEAQPAFQHAQKQFNSALQLVSNTRQNYN